MSPDILLSLLGYSLVAAATPGPNNLMVLVSGVNFGVRRSMPHLLGIAIGFAAMVLLLGLGLAEIFLRFPVAHMVLKYVSAAYMLWLAWKIATAAGLSEARAGAEPMSFLAAAAFQWVNPKAWFMALSALTIYAISDAPVLTALVVATCFGLVTMPSLMVWVTFGSLLREVLDDPWKRRLFNWSAAILLVLSLWPVLGLA